MQYYADAPPGVKPFLVDNSFALTSIAWKCTKSLVCQDFVSLQNTPFIVVYSQMNNSNLDTPTTEKKPQSLDTIDFAALVFLLEACRFCRSSAV